MKKTNLIYAIIVVVSIFSLQCEASAVAKKTDIRKNHDTTYMTQESTELHKALLAQQEQEAIQLAKQGADINAIDASGETPLSIARRYNLKEYIKFHENLFIRGKHFGKDFGDSNKHFVLLVASYNNASWYQKNLEMLFAQDYKKYTVIYMDDMSSDGTFELVSSALKKQFSNWNNQVILIKNTQKKYCIGNYLYAIEHFCPDNAILVTYDGDDWFVGFDELSYLNKLYADQSVWLTYGTPIVWPSQKTYSLSKKLSIELTPENFRKFCTSKTLWPISHLRSFYTWLFRKINISDLLDQTGELPKHGEDVAFMAPMIEMATHEHIRFVERQQYTYNTQNALNTNKVITRNDSLEAFHFFMNKTPYERLDPSTSKNEMIFESIYAHNGWGSPESVSGPGSTLAQTETAREWLPRIVMDFGIHSLVDVGCGDLNWMKSLSTPLQYMGVDIVRDLVEKNKKMYANQWRSFLVADVTKDPLPSADLVLCRDVLIHLSYADIKSALKNIKQTNSGYLIATTFPQHKNHDIVTGQWRPVNLQKPPFNFPEPCAIINERCPVKGAEDKSLAMWRLRDLEKAFQNEFVFIVPSYNNERWYKRNLDSIFSQTYPNYHVIYINDASTDNTKQLVQAYIRDNHLEGKITFIDNKERKLRHENIYNAVQSCDPHKIIVLVDGDDWIDGVDALNYLNTVYEDHNVWLTYGQFKYWPEAPGWAAQIPQEVIDRNEFRKSKWLTSHLITFYADLFHRIAPADHLYKGKFFEVAGDHAMLFPMLEMAGNHSKFISKILYVYNIETPINNFKIREDLAIELAKYARNKPRYARINQLFDRVI